MSLASYLHPYAQQLVLNALSRIKGARLTIKLQYQDPSETIQLGDGVEGDPWVVLTVHNPGFWIRLCSNFDLVSLPCIQTAFYGVGWLNSWIADWVLTLTPTRASQKATCSKT